jgi:hypothetical protein
MIKHMKFRDVVIAVGDRKGANLGEILKGAREGLACILELELKMVKVVGEFVIDQQLTQQSLQQLLDGLLDMESEGTFWNSGQEDNCLVLGSLGEQYLRLPIDSRCHKPASLGAESCSKHY